MFIRSAGTLVLLALFAAPAAAQQTATVFMGSEINFWHMGYDRTFTARVSFSYYEGGHMMYTRPSAHKALKADVAKFITANA